MSKLEQVHIVYVAADDRLLTRIATGAREELRCWLTRRLVKVLRPQFLDQLSRQTHSIFALLDTALASDWSLETALPQAAGEANVPPSTLD
jgi:hypothetical protein